MSARARCSGAEPHLQRDCLLAYERAQRWPRQWPSIGSGLRGDAEKRCSVYSCGHNPWVTATSVGTREAYGIDTDNFDRERRRALQWLSPHNARNLRGPARGAGAPGGRDSVRSTGDASAVYATSCGDRHRAIGTFSGRLSVRSGGPGAWIFLYEPELHWASMWPCRDLGGLATTARAAFRRNRVDRDCARLGLRGPVARDRRLRSGRQAQPFTPRPGLITSGTSIRH